MEIRKIGYWVRDFEEKLIIMYFHVMDFFNKINFAISLCFLVFKVNILSNIFTD